MDLKSIDLKNIKLEDIKSKIATIEKKTLIKYGVGFGAVIIFLIGYYSILNPIVNKKKELFQDKILKQDEINLMNTEIIAYKKTIKKKKPEFKESSKLFHSKAEVEGLYKSLSRYAGVNGLVISKIEKKKPKAVLKEGVTEQTENLTNKQDISYYKIPVTYEIKGNFLGYIKFKRALAKSKKMLNFDKEVISVVQNDSTGAIVAKGELTIVGLPDEFF
jgi:Tfp pilus assembly protein PilO